MANWRTAAAAFLLIALVITSEASRPGSFKEFLSTRDGDSTIWAILVAGSKEWINYRHQADVCHAYQILRKGGVKDENIVVFMYDDIANNSVNPNPGVIINSPNGPDVYTGVPKDYTGEDATADNFLAVLLGNSSAVKGGSGKVVSSIPNDRIFIYYSDHGSPGLLGMPSEGGDLYADDFIDSLKKKHASGTYDEMVIYVEACESGSMFEGLLPEDLNIYVTTAANATGDSYSTYCPGAYQLPPGYDTCLGDTYSVSWMEDSESEDLTVETLEEQYLKVGAKVKDRTWNNQSEELGYSHVMQYGTLGISKETVSLFQGSSPKNSATRRSKYVAPMHVVNQRDAGLYSMWYRYNRLTERPEQKAEQLKQIKNIMAHRAYLDASVLGIVEHIFGHAHGQGVIGYVRSEGLPLVDDWGCLKSVVRTFETYCGSLTAYGKKHMRTFANICNEGATMAAVEEASKATCKYDMGQWNPPNVEYKG